jgi:hypothetical protein
LNLDIAVDNFVYTSDRHSEKVLHLHTARTIVTLPIWYVWDCSLECNTGEDGSAALLVHALPLKFSKEGKAAL